MPRTAAPPGQSLAERDDELRKLILEMDQLEEKRAAIQRRIKQLMGVGGQRRKVYHLPISALDEAFQHSRG
ncbi:MAG: hypothetical protein LDL07_09985 [Desulfarculus sp.]|nr:hypothetical protein [Desulfarculus sp.]